MNSLTTECILLFRAGSASAPVKHPQEATRLRRRRPGVRGDKEPTEDEIAARESLNLP